VISVAGKLFLKEESKQPHWVTCFCITVPRGQCRWSPQPPHSHFALVALFIFTFLSPPSPPLIITVMFGLARNFMAVYNCVKQAVDNWAMSKRNLHPLISNLHLSSHPPRNSPNPITTPQP